MATIVCELCGASELIKDGDFFICKSCGTKYTLQEAKKLLGNSSIIDASSVANYLLIVKNAVKVKNYLEAELYSNKILEINPNNSEAWLNKGIAAGWLSNVQYFRLDEAINCFSNAIEFASTESKESVRITALENLQQATINSINAYYYFYYQAPRINAENTLKFIEILTTGVFPYIDEKTSAGEDYASPIAASILNMADGTVKESWTRFCYRHMCKTQEERDSVNYDYMFASMYYVYIVDKYINLKCVSLQQKISGLEAIINTCTLYLEKGTLRKDDFWKELIAKYSTLLHELCPSYAIAQPVQQETKKTAPKPKPKKKPAAASTSKSKSNKPTSTSSKQKQSSSKVKKSNPSIIEKLKGWFK